MTKNRTTTRPRRRLVVWHEQTLSSGPRSRARAQQQAHWPSVGPRTRPSALLQRAGAVTLDGPGHCRSRESCPNAEEPVADLL